VSEYEYQNNKLTLLDIGTATGIDTNTSLAYPPMQRNDRNQSQGGTIVGGGGCEEAPIPLLNKIRLN
jgi:hypothetical protein